MTYNTTFTLGDGINTVSWIVRPENVKTNPEINVVEHDIPGANHSILQGIGSRSRNWEFEFPLWKLDYITSTGATDPQDVYEQLENWALNHTTLDFISDYVTGVMGVSSVEVLIMNVEVTEIPGTRYNYVVSLTLKQYWSE